MEPSDRSASCPYSVSTFGSPLWAPDSTDDPGTVCTMSGAISPLNVSMSPALKAA